MLELIYFGVGLAHYGPDQMNIASELELMVSFRRSIDFKGKIHISLGMMRTNAA
jgi:hypothetical protein